MKGKHLSWVSETRLAWCVYVWPGHKGIRASDEARGQSPAGETEAHSQLCSLLSSYWGHQAPRASDRDPHPGGFHSSRVGSYSGLCRTSGQQVGHKTWASWARDSGGRGWATSGAGLEEEQAGSTASSGGDRGHLGNPRPEGRAKDKKKTASHMCQPEPPSSCPGLTAASLLYLPPAWPPSRGLWIGASSPLWLLGLKQGQGCGQTGHDPGQGHLSGTQP